MVLRQQVENCRAGYDSDTRLSGNLYAQLNTLATSKESFPFSRQHVQRTANAGLSLGALIFITGTTVLLVARKSFLNDKR